MFGNKIRRPGTVQFLQYTFDLSSNSLFANGTEVSLTQKDRELLRVFIDNRHRVVSRDELFKTVWAGQDVGDSALGFAIHHLRQCLGSRGQDVIRTVPGVGYQFNPALVAAASDRAGPRVLTIIALALLGLFLRPQPPHLPHVLSIRQMTEDMIHKAGGLVLENDLYFQALPSSLYRLPLSGRMLVPVLSGGELVGSTGGGLIYRDSDDEVWWWNPQTRIRKHLGRVDDGELSIFPGDGRWAVSTEKDVLLMKDGLLLSKLPKPPGVTGRVTWSPSGAKLVVSPWDDKLLQSTLWQAEPPIGFHLVIRSAVGDQFRDPEWTRDGRYLIFAVVHDGRSSRLWYRRESDGATGQLTSDALDLWEPIAGPKADVIYAIGGSRRLQLEKVENGRVIPYLSGLPYTYLDFSRDGATLIYSTMPGYSLWAAMADGTAGRRIVDGSVLEAHGSHLSPDGKTVAFMGRDRHGGYKIYTVPTSGGQPARLTTGTADEGIPTWSADGRYIAYGELRYRKDPKEMAIHVFDKTSKSESLLTDSSGMWSPRWSPDGGSIAAISADQRSLRRFDFRTHRWIDIARFSYFENPVWTPDSRFLYGDGTRPESGGKIQLFRVRSSDGAVEVLAQFDTGVRDWLGTTPDGSPLALQIFDPTDVYEIKVDFP